jgi:AcrR family transcriptional regulator
MRKSLRDNADAVEGSRASGGREPSSTGRPRGRPPKKGRGRARGVTRETILEAALKEFAECGYEGATTASIARRVRVTQPLIHYHFGSKQALWRATVDSIFARLSAQVEDAERRVEGMGPAAKFVTLTYSFIDFAVSNPELARITHNEGVVRTERLEWMVKNHLRPLYKRWGAYIESAKEAGIIKDLPPAFVVTALLGALAQFFDLAPLVREVWGIEPTTQENVRAYANSVVEMFLEGASVRIDEDFDTSDAENVGD